MTTTDIPVVSVNKFLMGGNLFTVRVSAEQTNNAIFVADFQAIPGSEPFRHVHTREDEIFIIKEGAATFFIGDEIITARVGDVVYLPVNVPHHFKITSAIAKGILIATPGNIENFFRELSVPFDGNEIPAIATPTTDQVQYMLTVAESYGMEQA